MKKMLLISVWFCAMFLSSCKECRTCIGYKNGVAEEYTNCSYGFPPSSSGLDAWDTYLLEVVGCDSVHCE
jgi:hypothetical protein